MAKEWRTALSHLPWRGPDEDRPGLPLPPGKMPLRLGGAWRKRWRYVGAFGESVMLCAASVRVGPFGQTFWAVLDRASGELVENTKQLLPAERGEVWTERGGGREGWQLGAAGGDGLRTKIDAKDAIAKLAFAETGAWAESICPSGGGAYVWTRKRPSWIDLDLDLGGRSIRERLRGIEDESAGYHPRHTVWSWSAGVGTSADGRSVAWNLVEGVNDPEAASERAIWIEGEDEPLEPGQVRFDGLEAVEFANGSRLTFEADAERRAEENRLVVKYSYRQPFGRFGGSLDGIQLAEGIGVMEHHDAHW